MNRQSIQKMALMLTGLEQRLSENRDYFKKITAAFKSGLKIFSALVSIENDKLKISFNGRNEIIEIQWLSARLSKYAESYDSVVITYEERGTTIIVEADNKNVKTRYLDAVKKDSPTVQHGETVHTGGREYYIKVGEADDLLREIGILSQDGKVKNDMIRKYNQIDHFVELIDSMLKSMDNAATVNVLDCGCGKSYLSFVINYYIREVLKKPCYFIGLDYSGQVIEASKKMAASLGFHNMSFHQTDIKSFTPDRDIHLVISLHACDTATDEAIAAAVRFGARSIAAVPCCHRELLSQYGIKALEPILKYGVLKARTADVLTDGLRALFLEAMGYNVSVVEYISPLETPKNLLIRAEKVSGRKSKELVEEYRELKKLLGVQPMLEKLIYDT